MDRYLFDIGGRILAVEAHNMRELKPYLDGFRPFIVDSGQPALTFVIESEVANPQGETIHEFDLNGSTGELSQIESGWCFVVKDDGRTQSLFTLNVSERKAICMISGDRALQNLKFIIWMAFGLVVLDDKFVSMHSSVIVKDGSAVMFLGESGTGKSTHTSLWLKYIEGSRLLNDDSPFVDVCGDKIDCCGSPWSGKGRCYINERYPIKGIVRLAQAPHNKMWRLDKLNAIGAIYPSCPPSFAYDESLSDMVFAIISRVVSDVPVYTLECLPDQAAAKLSYDTVFGN